jgi:RimJ/RimL family protein N-acetyltransferase
MLQPQADSSVVVFETPRLLARRIELADAAAMHRVYGDAEAMRWVGDGKPLDLAQCEHWVEVTHRNYATRGYGMFAVVCRESLCLPSYAVNP